MRGYWEFRSECGVFRIVPQDDRYMAMMFEDEALGSYWTPQQALDELIRGACGNPARRLAVPDDLSRWDFVPT